MGEHSSLSSSLGMTMRPLWPSKASLQSWLSVIGSSCCGSVHSARELVFVEHLPWARLSTYQESVRIPQWRRQGQSHSRVLGEEGIHRVSAWAGGWTEGLVRRRVLSRELHGLRPWSRSRGEAFLRLEWRGWEERGRIDDQPEQKFVSHRAAGTQPLQPESDMFSLTSSDNFADWKRG